MSLRQIPVTRTGNICFIDTRFEFGRGLCIATFDTGIRRRIPLLWRYTTCAWLIIAGIIITTYCLSSSYNSTLVFVISTTIGTVRTVT